MVFGFAVTAASRFFSPAMYGVHGGPGSTFSFFFWNAAFLVTLFDVSGLSFFLVSVFILVASWHFVLLLEKVLSDSSSKARFQAKHLAILMPAGLACELPDAESSYSTFGRFPARLGRDERTTCMYQRLVSIRPSSAEIVCA